MKDLVRGNVAGGRRLWGVDAKLTKVGDELLSILDERIDPAVDAAVPLDEAGRVPRQVVVDQDARLLQVDTFGQHLRGDEHANGARQRGLQPLARTLGTHGRRFVVAVVGVQGRQVDLVERRERVEDRRAPDGAGASPGAWRLSLERGLVVLLEVLVVVGIGLDVADPAPALVVCGDHSNLLPERR